MSREAEGFFSRWSRRKAEVREQTKVEEAQRVAEAPQIPSASVEVGAPPESSPAEQSSETLGSEATAEATGPTLAETESLTPTSDFTRFVGKEVSPEVRNAAMKKLFVDPHFNIVDGLDVYLDDFSKTEPIPAHLLTKMVGAQFLKLVEDPADQATEATELVSQASTPEGAATTDAIDGVGETDPDLTQQNKTEVPAPDAEQPIAKTHESHDNPDLQLQPNHSAGRQGAG